MTKQEAQHILGLRALPKSSIDLDDAFKKALVAAQARLSYAAAGSDRQPYLDAMRRLQEAKDLLAQALGLSAPSPLPPIVSRPTRTPATGQPGIASPATMQSPRTSTRQSTQRPASPRPQVQSSGQATATGSGSQWRFQRWRSLPYPKPHLSGTLNGVLALFRYGWAVIGVVFNLFGYAFSLLGHILRLLGKVLSGLVTAIVRIPPALTAAVILTLVVGVTGWWGVHWWQDNKPLLEVATMPQSDAFADGAALGLSPSPNPVMVSPGIHKIRCVSQFGPSREFWVFLLPGRRYQITVNLETREHRIHSSKDPSDNGQGRLRSWITGWAQSRPAQGR